MPRFIGRPNLPNALAQQLVKLASEQVDPLSVGLDKLAEVLDKRTAVSDQMKLKEREHQLRMDLEKQKLDMKREESRYKALTDLIKSGGMAKKTPASKPVSGKDTSGTAISQEEKKKMIKEGFRETTGEAYPAGYMIKDAPSGKVKVTPQLARDIPGLVPGTEVPATFPATYKRLSDQAKKSDGKDADRYDKRAMQLLKNNANYQAAVAVGDPMALGAEYIKAYEQAKMQLSPDRGRRIQREIQGAQEHIENGLITREQAVKKLMERYPDIDLLALDVLPEGKKKDDIWSKVKKSITDVFGSLSGKE